MGLFNYLFGTPEEREEKRKAKAEAWRELNEFADFSVQFSPPAPKHPDAAKWRIAWKVSMVMYQTIDDEYYKDLADRAANEYYKVAPDGMYGKARLTMSASAANKLKKKIDRIIDPDTKVSNQLACIYIGTTPDGKVYIGQTNGAPESRWKQHRDHGTGPCKDGAGYVNWDILEESVPADKLDEFEAYYIGKYNAYENGYNDTRGNDQAAYLKGRSNKV